MRMVKQLCQIGLDYQWVYPKEVSWAPLLFILFTTLLGDICRYYNQDFHLYADDTQLYAFISLLHLMSLENLVMLKINLCVDEISKWMSMNLLKLNEDKSEIMFYCNSSATF